MSSAIALVEVTRAAARRGPVQRLRAEELLRQTTLISVTEGMLQVAAAIGEPALRTLDAIHLATALEVTADFEALVTYDRRLADAAREIGIEVASPS